MLEAPESADVATLAAAPEESAALPAPAQGRAGPHRRVTAAPRCRRPHHPYRARAQMAYSTGGVDRLAAGRPGRAGPHRRDRRPRRDAEHDRDVPADGRQPAESAAPPMAAATAHPAAE